MAKILGLFFPKPKPLFPSFLSDIRIRLEWVAMVISTADEFLPPPEWVANELECSLGKWDNRV